MKKQITRFLLLALTITSVGFLSSCKDYDEDQYGQLKLENQSLKQYYDDLQSQVTTLQAQLAANNSCECDPNVEKFLKEALDKYAGKSFDEYIQYIINNYTNTTGQIDLTKYATKAELEKYATQEWVKSYLSAYSTTEQMNAAIKAAVDTISSCNCSGASGLSKGEVETMINTAIASLISQKDLKAAIDTLATKDEIKNFITISALNDYAKKADLDGLVNEDVLKDYAKSADLQAIQGELGKFATKDELSQYLKEADLNSIKEDLAKCATKDELSQYLKKADLSSYATVEYVDGQIDVVNAQITALKKIANEGLALAEQDSVRIDGIDSQISDLKETLGKTTTKAEEAYALAKKAEATAVDDSIRLDALEANAVTKKELEEAKENIATAVSIAVGLINQEFETVNNNITELGKDIQSVKDAYATADQKLQDQIDEINGKIGDINTTLTSIENTINKLQSSLAKLVTGIIIQQVYNPAFGSLSLPVGISTDVLVAYHGKNTQGKEVMFPTFDPKYVLVDNQTTIGEEGNAGSMYLTVNPNTVDFKDLKVSLVNSQDEESAITLSPLAQTDKVLNFGYTRAANNGFYVAKATLSKERMNNGKLRLAVDKSAIKDAVKDLIEVRAKSDIKPTIKELASVAYSTLDDLKLEALGVKCSWTDGEGAEHSVYSNYNTAAVAVAPLSFTALDDKFPRTSLPFYNKAVNLIDRLAKKIDDKIVDQINAQLKKYDEKINKRGIVDVDNEGDVVWVTISYYSDGTSEATHVKDNITALATLSGREMILDEDAKTIKVKYTSAEIVQIYNEAKKDEYLDETINTIAMNDLTNITDMCKDLLEQIHTYTDKIDNDFYLDRVHTYLDKINTYGTKILNKTPLLFKPILLTYSNKELNVCAFKGAAPTEVGASVTLIPTTYSAGMAAPVFKKYIRIDNGEGVLLSDSDDDFNQYKVTLTAGNHTIIYSALDYYGNQITASYVVTVK